MAARFAFSVPAARILFWRSLWVAMTATVSVVYLIPGAGPPGEAHLDKLAHVAAFAAMSFPARAAARTRHQFLGLMAVNTALAIVLELMQAFVPGRHFSMLDVLSNAVGLALGACMAKYAGAAIRAVAAPGRPRGPGPHTPQPIREG